jgi:membrane-bound metal-dependent hydrolase YbcI (DUF457 family)
MDIISHAMIGRIIAVREEKKKDIYLIPFFAALPDLFQIPLYLFLGYVNKRPFYFPLNSDWIGVRELYPRWVLFWEIPHSLFFLALVITPLVLLLKLNKLSIAAYFSHIFIDAFTHTGEWSLKPFFPVEYEIEGLTDAWIWKPAFFALSWLVLGLITFVLRYFIKKNKPADDKV